MAKSNILVPFGYKEAKSEVKGTFFIIDGFEDWSTADVEPVLRLAQERSFAEVVFVPQHEATLKRMNQPCNKPFYERVKRLNEMIDALSVQLNVPVTIDQWEGKRKAYTPLNALLRFLTEKYAGPHFIYMNAACTNMFASTPDFGAWMKKLRLFVGTNPQSSLHPKLGQVMNRWEEAGF
jgi:hypothetical protein